MITNIDKARFLHFSLVLKERKIFSLLPQLNSYGSETLLVIQEKGRNL